MANFACIGGDYMDIDEARDLNKNDDLGSGDGPKNYYQSVEEDVVIKTKSLRPVLAESNFSASVDENEEDEYFSCSGNEKTDPKCCQSKALFVLITFITIGVLFSCTTIALRYSNVIGCKWKDENRPTSQEMRDSYVAAISRLQNMTDEMDMLERRSFNEGNQPNAINQTDFIEVEKKLYLRNKIVDREVEKLINQFRVTLQAVRKSQMAETVEKEAKMNTYLQNKTFWFREREDKMIQAAVNDINADVKARISNVSRIPGPEGDPGIPGIQANCKRENHQHILGPGTHSLSFRISITPNKVLLSQQCYCTGGPTFLSYREEVLSNGDRRYTCDLTGTSDANTNRLKCTMFAYYCYKRPKPDD